MTETPSPETPARARALAEPLPKWDKTPTDRDLEAMLPALSLAQRIEAIIRKYVAGEVDRAYDGETRSPEASERIARYLVKRMLRWLPDVAAIEQPLQQQIATLEKRLAMEVDAHQTAMATLLDSQDALRRAEQERQRVDKCAAEILERVARLLREQEDKTAAAEVALRRAEQERDELREQAQLYIDQREMTLAALRESRARVEQLKAYTRHNESCPQFYAPIGDGPAPAVAFGPCNCGLEAALASAGEATQE